MTEASVRCEYIRVHPSYSRISSKRWYQVRLRAARSEGSLWAWHFC